MKYGSLILEKKEYLTLKRILNFHRHYEDYGHKNALERLKERMDSALILDEEEVPDDVVRLYSEAVLSNGDGANRSVQLVLPTHENIKTGKISVISTLGAHLIGLALGDTVRAGIPSNGRTLRIVKLQGVRQESQLKFSQMNF